MSNKVPTILFVEDSTDDVLLIQRAFCQAELEHIRLEVSRILCKLNDLVNGEAFRELYGKSC